jgi:hypothetical protein
MAASILKAMSFPREVASASIDSSGKAKSNNCTITDVAVSAHGGVTFQRLDAALPYFPEQAKSILQWAPLLEEMNHYGLQVKGLQAGTYEVRLGGNKVAQYSAEELGSGVNLAAAALSGGPVADQVKKVVKAVDAKTNYFHDKIFRGLVLANVAKLPEFKDVPPGELEKRRQALIEERLKKMPELDAAIRAALETKPYPVEIAPVK